MLLPLHTMHLQVCASPSGPCITHLPAFVFSGPHWGRGSGSQLNRLILGVHLSGIRGRCPSLYNRCLGAFSESVSMSPHCCLILWDVMCLSHCCWFEICLRCCKCTCGGRSWVSLGLFCTVSSSQLHIAWWKEHRLDTFCVWSPLADLCCWTLFDRVLWTLLRLACAILLSMSACIRPDGEITDPKYKNSLTFSISLSPTEMGVLSVSVASLPVTRYTDSQAKVTSYFNVSLMQPSIKTCKDLAGWLYVSGILNLASACHIASCGT